MLKNFIEQNKNDILFQRNSYRRFIYIALFMVVINFGLVGLLYYKLLTIKTPPNFATTSDGRLIEIFPE